MTSTIDPANWPVALCRTPERATLALVAHLRTLGLADVPARFLDAGCGSGAIAFSMSTVGLYVDGVDTLQGPWLHGHRWRGDFLAPVDTWADGYRLDERTIRGRWDAVVSNPPFLLGPKPPRYDPAMDGVLQFVNRGLELAPVVFALHRSGLWDEQQPVRVAWRASLRARYVTERIALGRLAFLGGRKVDSTPYAWLCVREPRPEDGPGPWVTRQWDAS